MLRSATLYTFRNLTLRSAVQQRSETLRYDTRLYVVLYCLALRC